MIPMVAFSAAAAFLVFLAGRGDKARDPRLTGLALGLLAAFPLLTAVLPAWDILPARPGGRSGLPWAEIVASGWVIGFTCGAVRLALAARAVSKWRQISVLIRRSGKFRIRRVAGLAGPVAAGVLRPVIFVPDDWELWPAATRRIVLKHEIAHHRRRDPLWRWLAEIACVIHGLNPLVVWISRRLVLQCEYACDARVLAGGVSRTDYARLLCDLATASPPRGPALAMASQSTLESRVSRLVSPRPRRGTIWIGLLLAILTAVAGVLAALQPAKVPDDVELRWSAKAFPGEG